MVESFLCPSESVSCTYCKVSHCKNLINDLKNKESLSKLPNASGILIVFPNPSNDNIITSFMFDNIPRCEAFFISVSSRYLSTDFLITLIQHDMVRLNLVTCMPRMCM